MIGQQERENTREMYTHTNLNRWIEASSVIMKATRSTEQLFSNVTGPFANDAIGVFDVRLGSHISRMFRAEEFQPERKCRHIFQQIAKLIK